MQPIDHSNTGRPVSILAINDALSAPFDADDIKSALSAHPELSMPGIAARVDIAPSLGVCPKCGDEVCAHRPQMLERAEKELLAQAEGPARIVVAAAGSSAPVALMLASLHPSLVAAIVLVRPRLGTGAPKESLFARLMRRLAWPCCVLIGAEPQRPEIAAVTGMRLADLGRRLRAIGQPALIIHARSRRCDAFDDAWLLQRELAGMVEMVTIPDGEGSRSILGELGLDRLRSFVARIAIEARPPARPAVASVPAPQAGGARRLAHGPA